MSLVMICAGLLTVLVASVGHATSLRHAAAAAADLSALSAASALVALTPAQACGRAREVAVANRFSLLACRRLVDGSVLVKVGLRGSEGWWPGPVSAVARAGPGPENAEAFPRHDSDDSG